MFEVNKDETYDYIEGKWLNDEKDCVIHRIASNFKEKNILKQVLAFCLLYCDNVRIDRHNDNNRMKETLKRNGFVECGLIYLKDGNPRNAYHFKINEK